MNRPTKIGKYEVIDVIGRGGMGIVYKATDPHLDRLVAIKMLRIGDGDDPQLLKRFYREAQSTGSLQHPNIVTVYELGDQDGNPYLVMEYLDGETMDALISSRRPLSILNKIRFVIEACRGLSYAHGRGIVHRDIKPGNIMILKNGSVKLVDFGIAHFINTALTLTGEIMGSVNYMSPEQIEGKEVDARTDIFSLGIVLYRLLTNALPFEADGTAQTFLKIIQEPPPPLSQFLSVYPEGLEAVVQRALSKNRNERYPSADEFALGLSMVQEQLRQEPATERGVITATGSAAITQTVPIPALPHQQGLDPSAPESHTVLATRPVATWVLDSDAAAAIQERSLQPATPSDSTCIFAPTAHGGTAEHVLPRVRLTFTAGNDGLLIGKSVVVSSVPFRIGRNADLSIADVHLSREHAVIDWDGKSFNISDQGSKNGTYVNGKQLRTGSQSLPFGAVIRLGRATVLTFSSDEISELPDLMGQTIANRYQLTKVLRNGTKTALYEAKDSHLPQKVAVKILSPSLASYGGYLAYFNREAEMAASLRHPHICRVLDYGRASVRIGLQPSVELNYLSMELMEGGSLEDRVAQGIGFDLSEILSWLNDITNALESAHRQGVTHGGLKASSIVFDREGVPYVTDFATACRSDDEVRPVFVGSPEFLSPEQWDGSRPSPLSDEYALAVLTYLLIAGSCPFEGQIDPKVRERNFIRGPVPVHEEAARTSRPTVSPHISEVLNRALSLQPTNRYTSVREFFLALQAVSEPKSRAEGPARVFISYQRDSSSGWAVHFASELDRQYHIAAFVDTQRMDSAVRFPVRLKNAIENCDVFVCFLSASALQSKWVQEEIRLAWVHNKPMIPVFQESYSQPGPSEQLEPHVETLINYDGVKLLDRQNLYVESAIEKLAEMVTESVRKSNS